MIRTLLSKYEQETISLTNAGEQTATVYTAEKAVMRKLDRYVREYPEVYQLVSQNEISKTYSMPKSYITFRKPRKISEEQRELAREKMKAINGTVNIGGNGAE